MTARNNYAQLEASVGRRGSLYANAGGTSGPLAIVSNATLNGSPNIGTAMAFTSAVVAGLPETAARTYRYFIGAGAVGSASTPYSPIAGDVGLTLTVQETITNSSGSIVSTSAGSVVGTTITTNFTDATANFGFFGYSDALTTTTVRSYTTHDAAWCGYITGSAATLTCGSGNSTPYFVSVDGGAETLPIRSGSIMPLFAGLSDAPHFVQISANTANSPPFQNFPLTGTQFSVTGVAPAMSAVGPSQLLNDPAFVGQHCMMSVATSYGANVTPTYKLTNAVGFGLSTGSLLIRAKCSGIWIFTGSQTAYFSEAGGSWKQCRLQAPLIPINNGASDYRRWKKVQGIVGNLSTFQDYVIVDVPMLTTVYPTNGVMLEGSGAAFAAPTARTRVYVYGDSTTAGLGADIGVTEYYQAKISFSTMIVGSTGASGNTISQGTTGMPAYAAGIAGVASATVVLNLGINSPNGSGALDTQFIADYQALINAALTAGFNKVLCRGIVTGPGVQTAKNLLIAQAVTNVANAKVIYTGMAGCPSVQCVDGSGGVHPTAIGYATEAAYIVANHGIYLP